MTTFTFRAENSETEKLFAILQSYGVKDLQIGLGDDILDISEEEILEAELGLVEANEGFLLSDDEVQKKAQSICIE